MDHVLDKPCPKCRGPVTYNGNYYCLNCTWGLSERGDVQPWLLSLIRLRRNLGWDTSREEEYLDGHPQT